MEHLYCWESHAVTQGFVLFLVDKNIIFLYLHYEPLAAIWNKIGLFIVAHKNLLIQAYNTVIVADNSNINSCGQNSRQYSYCIVTRLKNILLATGETPDYRSRNP